MKSVTVVGAVLLVSSLLGAPATVMAAPPWTYTTSVLGTFDGPPDAGGVMRSGAGINDKGQVAGTGYTPLSGADHALLWEPGSGLRDLGTLRATINWSRANSINNRGQVVGASDTGDGESHRHAFLWQANTGMRDLGTFADGPWSEAVGINDRGEVIGYAPTGIYTTPHAFIWDERTGMRDLGTLDRSVSSVNATSYAAGLNNRGQVIGDSDTAGGVIHAFLWDARTGMRDLGSLGGASTAVAFNDKGQVVGYSDASYLNSHAFLWEATTGMRDLGTLPGDTTSIASGINSRGQVIGWSGSKNPDGTMVATHAFVWDARTGMHDLGGFGGATEPGAINDRGQVVGTASSSDGTSHAFIWDPKTGMHDLGAPPSARGAAAWTFNVRGQVLGSAAFPNPDSGGLFAEAVVWTPAERP